MAIPTAITFHDLRPSNAVEATVPTWGARPQPPVQPVPRRQGPTPPPPPPPRHGRAIEVHVVLGVPGSDITSSRVRHEDAYAAIADAFRCTRRQLLDALATRRDFVKAPAAAEPPPQPRISFRS